MRERFGSNERERFGSGETEGEGEKRDTQIWGDLLGLGPYYRCRTTLSSNWPGTKQGLVFQTWEGRMKQTKLGR